MLLKNSTKSLKNKGDYSKLTCFSINDYQECHFLITIL